MIVKIKDTTQCPITKNIGVLPFFVKLKMETFGEYSQSPDWTQAVIGWDKTLPTHWSVKSYAKLKFKLLALIFKYYVVTFFNKKYSDKGRGVRGEGNLFQYLVYRNMKFFVGGGMYMGGLKLNFFQGGSVEWKGKDRWVIDCRLECRHL